jgi:hypothetical protein
MLFVVRTFGHSSVSLSGGVKPKRGVRIVKVRMSNRHDDKVKVFANKTPSLYDNQGKDFATNETDGCDPTARYLLV